MHLDPSLWQLAVGFGKTPPQMKWILSKIVSGGQTGVDRAALDLALELGIPCGGWCPRGRLAEDGVIHSRYPLQETESEIVAQRTEWNVRDSDATLIVAPGALEGGTKLTAELANNYAKPLFIVDSDGATEPQKFRNWLAEYGVQVLNIAGPRDSLMPGGVYARSRQVLLELLSVCRVS